MTSLDQYREKKLRDGVEAFKLLGLLALCALVVLAGWKLAEWVLS